MYKKLLSYVAAAALTVSMIFSTGVTAFAGGPETSTSSPETSTSETNSNSETSSGTNSSSQNPERLEVHGDQDSTVTEPGVYGNVDVSGVATGVNASGSQDIIEIHGHVSADADGVGIQATDGAEVRVFAAENSDDAHKYPYVSGGNGGVITDGDANLYLGGRVSGGSNGAIVITPDDDNTHGRLDVIGDIAGATISDGTQGPSINVDVSNYNNKTYTNMGDAITDVKNDLPDMYLYKLAGEIAISKAEGMTVGDGSGSNQTNDYINKHLQNAVYEAINYYVYKSNGVSVSKEGNTSSGNVTVKFNQDNTGLVITGVGANEELVVHNARLTPGENGTYTLWMTSRDGGVYITKRTLIRPVVDENNNVTYEVVPQQNQVVETPAAPESASGIVVATTQNETTTPPEVLAAIGYKPARTVSMNMNTVTPKQYKEAVITNIATAPANGAFNIETNGVSVFDAAMMEAFASRPDVDVNVMFTYNGVRYLVTIPAGYNVKSLLDSNGYCGYLRLMSILGGVTIY